MTVDELRQALKDVPDDWKVLVRLAYGQGLGPIALLIEGFAETDAWGTNFTPEGSNGSTRASNAIHLDGED